MILAIVLLAIMVSVGFSMGWVQQYVPVRGRAKRLAYVLAVMMMWLLFVVSLWPMTSIR